MPELPEVEAICRHLSPLVEGVVINHVEIILPRILRGGDFSILVDRKIKSVTRRGKGIIISTDTDVTLYVHLRMSGTLLWSKSDSSFDRYVRARIRTDRGDLLYRDIRTLGGLWIGKEGVLPWKEMGPDPFDPSLDAKLLHQKLLLRRSPIKSILLDQSVLAGIGNIYASEILFASRIDPRSNATSLAPKQSSIILEKTRLVLQSAIDSKGTTFRDFRLSDGREGAFQEFLQVYARAGKPCRNCGATIERIVQSGRSSFFCPKCQKINRPAKKAK